MTPKQAWGLTVWESSGVARANFIKMKLDSVEGSFDYPPFGCAQGRQAQDVHSGQGSVCVASVLRPLKRTVVSGEQVKGASAGKCVEA